MNFKDLGILDRLTLFPDGRELVNYIDAVLSDIIEKNQDFTQPV